MKKDTKTTKNLPYNPEITKHDMDILEQKDAGIRKDGGDDINLLHRKDAVDFTGEDLDIPGRNEAKKGNGPLGLNDEENKLHSQGADRKTNLERNES
ncbi:hypothetical protein ACE939_05340 [Aquimarina sp. W85]|uniref:hypothetical protein n=1 Tax=Aquimarina rhodophyticola TaxID=3342246 RepID=UPI00366B83A2